MIAHSQSVITTMALMSLRQGMRQPVTWLAMIVGLALLLMSALFGLFSFSSEDRIRLVMSAGIASVQIIGLFIGVWTASHQIHDELTGRTALTLFSKPVGRHHFLLGNSLGSIAVALIPCGIIATLHLLLVASLDHWGFDAIHGHQTVHRFIDEGTISYARLLWGHLLAMTGIVTLVCLSTSLALLMPLVLNLCCCLAAFVLAHLSGDSSLPGWGLLPPLPLFSLDQAINSLELPLSGSYLALCLVSGLLYSAGFLCCSLAIFSRRDIT